ncbi:TetR/AcrR family transcriptional regulator [Shouchella clausii]|jgi:AcrR family transcriptional regulator|uniref:HTH tetR-type domain-containing protein n=1 Tax=Shouchella clausii TaxID=79880 RepID=A0A268S5J7_SHOCL|nr:TetR-like C-terminal domain-containing protein [Shouchella clausii]PAD43476.1 hypothetical protein CHH54_06870 [Bacillus sp. 7520-S]SPU18966.1 TetR family transcriptional regulator [Niallia circulans]AST95342.1 hypothetical protein BC8716_04805 [Shouchella clausii]MBU8595428.1 TetR family transcriptional regulator C-terminal domain-containing protein [Shouchella clausii]MCM3548825.1 TetR family transcriptional regulator C-terminal domain-containing protein [Shouchella clausii]
MNGKVDRRIERTKRDIRMAFIDLIRENDAKDLTVKEITSLANYNRTTFYAHYSGQDELIEDIIDDAIQGFISKIEPTFQNGEVPLSIKLSSTASKTVFKYIEDNKAMFSLLFDVNKFPSFQEKLCSAIKDLLESDIHFLKQYKSKLDRSLYCYTQSAALVGRINFWIKEGYTYSADYMAEQMVEYLKLFK